MNENINITNNETYESTITFTTRELNPIEKIKLKDLTATVALDDELKSIPDHKLTFTPELIVIVSVHNPKAKSNLDYETLVFTDSETGVRYRTSSMSFKSAVLDIVHDLILENINPNTVPLVAYTRPSKNFTGKDFLTCTIA